MEKTRLFATSAIITIALVALSRLIPHWPNFTPVMAVALVGGTLFTRRLTSVLVPIAAMVMSDIALGAAFGLEYALHSTQIVVYGCIIAIALFGNSVRSWRPATLILGGGSLAAITFFLVSNFAVWISGTMYPVTMEGLVACYGAGLAFSRDGGNFLFNGIASTWLFSALIVYAPRLVTRAIPTVKADYLHR